MSFRRVTVYAASIAALSLPAAAAPASAQTPVERTVTAIGAASERVEPTDSRDNASIRRAVRVARDAAVGDAIDDARRRARLLAAEADLTLGELLSVGEAATAPWEGGYETQGVFGPGRYCGNVRRPIIRRRDGRRRVVGHRTRRICHVPTQVTTRVEVVFSATPA